MKLHLAGVQYSPYGGGPLAIPMNDPVQHCANCGNPLAERGGFCSVCGWALPPRSGADAATDLPTDREAVDVPWTVVHITAGLFLFLGILFVAAFSARAIGPSFPKYEAALETWVAVHLLAIGVGAVVWIMGVRRAPRPLRALGLIRPYTPTWLSALWSVGALGFSIGATFLYGLVVEGLGLESLRPPDVNTDVIFPGVGILLTLQALALVTPITEEILFRGFALRGLMNRMGAGPAVVSHGAGVQRFPPGYSNYGPDISDRVGFGLGLCKDRFTVALHSGACGSKCHCVGGGQGGIVDARYCSPAT